MRTYTAILAATLSLVTVVPSFAQAPDLFKDVDPNGMHWAYQGLENLRKRNIVWGYPDGYYRGKRTITRYEFAVALDRALQSIPMREGAQGPVGPMGPAGPAGPQGPKGDVGPAGMTPAEVAQFRRLLQEFKDELASMGNNTAAINRKVDTLAKTVDDINKRLDKLPRIYGGAWLGFRSDRANGGYIDYDGRVFGIGSPGGSGLISTPVAVHQYMFGVNTNIPGGGTLDVGLTSNNYKNFLGGNIAQINPLITTPDADTYIHHLEIKTPFTGLGRGSNLTMGRFGHRISHLTLWKPDVDRAFNNPFEDNGQYFMDGIRLTTNFGSVGTEIFGGQTKANTGINFGAVNSPFAGTSLVGGIGDRLFPFGGGLLDKPFGQPNQGQMTVDQLAGISLGLGIRQLQGGNIRFTAMNLSSERTATAGLGFSNVTVLGSDFDLKLCDRLNVSGDWAKTITGTGRFDTVNPHFNNAFNGMVNFHSGGLGIGAGYKYIDPLFYAPGYWGRIGNWLNPTNIQGPTFRAGYDFSPTFGLNIGGDFFSAARGRATTGGLGRDDEISRILAGLRWDVSKNFHTTVDWEGVFWTLDGPHGTSSPGGSGRVHPTENYITLGTGLNLTPNTTMSFKYVIGDFDGHSFFSSPVGQRYNFNTFTSSVAVRF